jgi:hypothetical protein
MSQSIAMHLTPDELSIILCCLDEVRITNRREAQRALFERLSKSLRRAMPREYEQAVVAGDFSPLPEPADK